MKTTKPVSIVFVGVGGYGAYLYRLLRTQLAPSLYELVGVVDPYAHLSPQYEAILQEKIPIFEDLSGFYQDRSAELCIIASPLPLHKQQVIEALRSGSDVLCEKPLTPCVQDMYDIEAVLAQTGRRLGIGYQWCFADTFLKLKRDILAGLLGDPLEMKCFISWKRYDDYYKKWWSGRIKGPDGCFILDSVLTNATCHYLQNMLFLLGDEMDRAAMPDSLCASLYRAKDIESFDTDVLMGRANGCNFYHYATHSGQTNTEPRFVYTFQRAVVDFNMNGDDPCVTARFHNGETKVYGSPFSDHETAQKIQWMIRAAREPDLQIPCGIDTAIPQALVCNAIFDQVPIVDFPKPLLMRENDPAGTFISGLYEQLYDCFQQSSLPGAMGFDWAAPETEVQLAGYRAFDGSRY